jgi:hypothetical protein
VDELIGYLAEGKLAENAVAVAIAQREYWKFIKDRIDDDAVETYLEYYRALKTAFEKAGIEM